MTGRIHPDLAESLSQGIFRRLRASLAGGRADRHLANGVGLGIVVRDPPVSPRFAVTGETTRFARPVPPTRRPPPTYLE